MALLRTELAGHLTLEKLEEALRPITRELGRGDGRGMLLDVREMTGYDAAARSHFVAWNTAHRARLRGVAIVTDNTLWRVVIATMSLASGQRMKAFDGPEDGMRWLEGLVAPREGDR